MILDIDFDSLSINADSFDLGGNFLLPEKVGGHKVKLSGNELLRVENNDIRFTNGGKIDPKLEGEFDFFNAIGIKTAKAELSYDDVKNELKLQGKYTLEAPLIKIVDDGFPAFIINLTGRDNFISIKDGIADFKGEFLLKNLKLPELFEIPELKIGIKTENGEIKEIVGGLEAKFPAPTEIPLATPFGVGVEIGFRVNPFEFDDFILKLPELKIPAPTLPTFINSVKLGFENIAPTNPDPFTVVGGLGMSFGNPIPIKIPTILSTLSGISTDPAPVKLDLTGKFSLKNFEAIGKLTVVNDKIMNVEGNFLWDWNKDFITAKGEVKALFDFFTGTANFKFDEVKSTYTGSGTVELSIPNIPFLPGRGKKFSNSTFQALYSDDNNSSNDYIASWDTRSTLGKSITSGLQYYFDGTFKPIFSGKEIPIIGSWEVESDFEWLIVTAEWENATDEDVALRVINEQGEPIEEADFAANNIAIVEDLSGANTKTVIIDAPNPGVWDMEIVDDNGLGTVEYIAYRDTAAPTIEITAPATDVNGGEVTIEYEAFDPDSEAEIQLFYDDDNEGFDGVLITNDLIEQDGEGTFLWNTQGIATGEYYIYGMVKDDENAPVFDYSSGKVLIAEAADLSVTQTVDTESIDIGKEQTYTVTVSNNGKDNAKGVQLTYTIPEGATFVSATIEPSEQTDNTINFDLGDLANGDNTSLDITINASNILESNVSSAFVKSNTYDPDRANNTASLATTVLNSESLPELSVSSVSQSEQNEATTDFIFTVSLSQTTEETVTVDFTTVDISAIAEEDYTATNGTLEFAPGEVEKTVTVQIIGDTEIEEDEIFSLNLSNANGAAIADSQGIGNIRDEDTVTPLLSTLNFGTIGDDRLNLDELNTNQISFTGAGNDLIDAVAVNSPQSDRLYAGGDDDELLAGTNDRLFGGTGNDILDARNGNGGNRLFGGDGNDTLFARKTDLLFGGDGNDILFAGEDKSVLSGGEGSDQFWLTQAALPTNSNTILDFEVDTDDEFIGIGGLTINGQPVEFSDLSITSGTQGVEVAIPELSETPLAIVLGVTQEQLNNSENFRFS